MANVREVPEGFRLVESETEAAGTSYTVPVLQAESLDAILNFYRSEGKNGEEILLQIWNSGNMQSARQGRKSLVRDAIENGKITIDGTEYEGDEAVQAAIEAHRTASAQTIQGAPRGGGGRVRHESGLSAKKREELGSRVAMFMVTEGRTPNAEEIAEIAAELGINPELL